nr:hypothetical protein [Mycoplasmopsis bovis]
MIIQTLKSSEVKGKWHSLYYDSNICEGLYGGCPEITKQRS